MKFFQKLGSQLKCGLAVVVIISHCAMFSCKPKEQAVALKIALVLGSDRAVDRVMKAGAEKAAQELGLEVSIKMSGTDVSSQNEILSEQQKLGVSAIAVSPMAPSAQSKVLNEVAESMRLIVMGSDAPQSKRHAFVGMNAYDSGRMAGQLVKEAMPQGGKVAIFLGLHDDKNELMRRQGVIDELLDRTNRDRKLDELGALINGGKYQVLGTLIDQGDVALVGSNVEDLLKKEPTVGCAVGLQGYHAAMILAKLGENRRLAQVKVVAFDEDLAVLDGIASGYVQGTVVQDPFACGYEAVKLLKILSENATVVDHEVQHVVVPARIINKTNLASFRDEWKAKTSGE